MTWVKPLRGKESATIASYRRFKDWASPGDPRLAGRRFFSERSLRCYGLLARRVGAHRHRATNVGFRSIDDRELAIVEVTASISAACTTSGLHDDSGEVFGDHAQQIDDLNLYGLGLTTDVDAHTAGQIRARDVDRRRETSVDRSP